jgi:DNA modification methylase
MSCWEGRKVMPCNELDIKNTPKQKNNTIYANSNWYHYYAGFSDSFVTELLNKYCTDKNTFILDPWNGAGTTTFVSNILGYKSYGFDINPVMIIVSRAKLFNFSDLDADSIDLAVNKCSRILSKSDHQNDPLSLWFNSKSVCAIRALEQILRSFSKQTISDDGYIKSIWNYVNPPVDLCFFYVVLFNVLRKLTKAFSSSNPTWIKMKIREEEKLTVSYDKLSALFLETLRSMEYSVNLVPSIHNTYVRIANSTNIPINDKSVDLVLTSPPYCTRIDYAIYTVVELALLGYSGDEFDLLRRNMIGTPTISKDDFSTVPFGTECMHTLNQIKNHHSKSAKSYYYKTYLQYFASLRLSIQEICRVMKDNESCMVVVQDSWFKDIHVPITKIISEFFSDYFFDLYARKDNATENNMRYINTKSKCYNKDRNTETILIFTRKNEV